LPLLSRFSAWAAAAVVPLKALETLARERIKKQIAMTTMHVMARRVFGLEVERKRDRITLSPG
jgi:hypothetical protein